MYQKQAQLSRQESTLALLPLAAQSCYLPASCAVIRGTQFGRKLRACCWPYAQLRINAIPITGPLTLNKKGRNTFSLREIQAFNRSGNLGQKEKKGVLPPKGSQYLLQLILATCYPKGRWGG